MSTPEAAASVGTSERQIERRTRCAWLLAAPFLLVNLLDGFNKPALANDPLLYWTYDLTKWVLLPAVTLFAMRVWCRLHPADFGLRGPGGRWSALALAGLTVLCTALSMSYFGFELLGEYLAPDDEGVGIDHLIPTAGWPHWLVTIYLAASAGFVEELFYRGVLRELLAPPRAGVVRASGYVVASSVLFGLSHFEGGTVAILASGLYGVVAAVFALWVRNLVPLMVGHFTIDLIALR